MGVESRKRSGDKREMREKQYEHREIRALRDLTVEGALKWIAGGDTRRTETGIPEPFWSLWRASRPNGARTQSRVIGAASRATEGPEPHGAIRDAHTEPILQI